MTRGFAPACLAILLLGCAAASFAADVPALRGKDPVTGCRFELPQRWRVDAVRWVGRCSAQHLADGPGVLRALQGGKVAESFFGRLHEGRLVSGAIETDSGYVAGRFDAGKPAESADRADMVSAFENAALGASAASEAFQREGNAASSRYYRQKAARLREQMD